MLDTEPRGANTSNAVTRVSDMIQWKDIQERISDCLNNKQSNKKSEETMEDVRSQVQTAAEVVTIIELWEVLRNNENATAERLFKEFITKAYGTDATAEIMEMAFPDKGAD